MEKIKKIEINTEKILSKDFQILTLSDLHLTEKIGIQHLNNIINSKKISYENLDYILIPGDLINDTNELEKPKFKQLFLDEITALTRNIPTMVSFGNHDQMTKTGSTEGKWLAGDKKLLELALRELPNVTVLKNGQPAVETEELTFGAFSPLYSYYEGLHESKESYERNFFANYQDDLFTEDKFNIYLTHEPQSIIKLSKEYGFCIQPNTDLVVSGHMHNGLLPAVACKFIKNVGLVSPQKQLFPEYAQGEVEIEHTKFIINGPVNTRVEFPLLNQLYEPKATVITLKKVR